MKWTKQAVTWIENRVLYVSIPFTWNLPDVKAQLDQRSFFWDNAVVGGPAVILMPDYLADLQHVSIGNGFVGALQKVHPMATRTTYGCIRKCDFCAVRRIEGPFRERKDWPDLPMIIDSNLLAASEAHFDKVMDRLEKHSWCDFSQGLDARLLTKYHASRLARLNKPIVRLALDDMSYADSWQAAFNRLISAGVPKSRIRSYSLIAYSDGPKEAWERCEWLEGYGIKAYPMWYHSLAQLELNIVTERQQWLGWNEVERKRIMGWYYHHRGQRYGTP